MGSPGPPCTCSRSVEVFANGRIGEEIFPANEIRRLIKLGVGLSESDTSGSSRGGANGYQAYRVDGEGEPEDS